MEIEISIETNPITGDVALVVPVPGGESMVYTMDAAEAARLGQSLINAVTYASHGDKLPIVQ